MTGPTALLIAIAATLVLAAAAILLIVINTRTLAGLRRDAREILTGLSDGIVILSEKPDRVYCNPAAEAMLGLPPEPDLAPRYHRLDRSRLLGEVCAAATAAPRGAVLPPMEMVDANGHFRSWSQSLIRASVAGRTVVGVVLQDRTEIHTLSHLLEESRRRDPLTGLATPELLHDRTGQAIEAAARMMTAVAMLVVEVDQFEAVFEQGGWSAASELLIEAGMHVSTQVRAIDLIARVGQNRFAIVLSLSDAASLPAAVDRFLAATRFVSGRGADRDHRQHRHRARRARRVDLAAPARARRARLRPRPRRGRRPRALLRPRRRSRSGPERHRPRARRRNPPRARAGSLHDALSADRRAAHAPGDRL